MGDDREAGLPVLTESKGMQGKGDYRGEEAGAGWAVLGTAFVE